MRRIVLGFVFAVTTPLLVGQNVPNTPASHPANVRQPIVSDWTSRHVLYPESRDNSAITRNQSDPRWLHGWYLRHQEAWWPEHRRWHHKRRHRDWSVSLSANASTSAFEPLFDFSYAANLDTGYGSVNTTDNGSGQYLATSGFLVITATGTNNPSGGMYPLYPEGPGRTLSPSGKFQVDDLVYPGVVPPIDNDGLLFIGGGFEFNLWSNFPGPDNYEFDDYDGSNYTNAAVGNPFILTTAPGGGQTSPAKFVFDVNAAPSCTNDYAVIGIPATPASGGQANIVGVNNLYSGGTGALCPSGPTVMFAYASGTGQVPASIAISQNGSQIAYIENLSTGSSYFHVLTLGTTGTNGTSATAAVVPGTGNNAVDQSVLLSPDGGVTTQASTNTVFVRYTPNDASDTAYATTYNPLTATGYLYKIGNVFNGSAAPTIVWSVPVTAVPSSPVYDSVSNRVFFTDGSGRVDYVVDSGSSPSVVYSSVLANGATSENPVIVDSLHQMVYASFNTNGTNALVVQAPTSMASTVSVPVGTGTTVYTAPYEPNFNNAWFTGSGTPEMYVAGLDATGTIPTLYSVGFNGSGVMNSIADATTAALTTGMADSSPLTEFYNPTAGKDYLFVGVTDHCVATTGGLTAGCVMSLDITNGFPTVNASSVALPAAGGTTGIVVDNDSNSTGASSIYYATKTGANLVKATQSGLN